MNARQSDLDGADMESDDCYFLSERVPAAYRHKGAVQHEVLVNLCRCVVSGAQN